EPPETHRAALVQRLDRAGQLPGDDLILYLLADPLDVWEPATERQLTSLAPDEVVVSGADVHIVDMMLGDGLPDGDNLVVGKNDGLVALDVREPLAEDDDAGLPINSPPQVEEQNTRRCQSHDRCQYANRRSNAASRAGNPHDRQHHNEPGEKDRQNAA